MKKMRLRKLMNDLEEIIGRDLKNLEESALHRIRDFLDPGLCIHTLIDVNFCDPQELLSPEPEQRLESRQAFAQHRTFHRAVSERQMVPTAVVVWHACAGPRLVFARDVPLA